MKIFKLFFLFCIFVGVVRIIYYQQTFHLSGSINGRSTPVYGEKGEFSPENTIGAISSSTSFLISNDTEVLVFFGYTKIITGEVYETVDRVWKYSIPKGQWMFIRGRKEVNKLEVAAEIGKFLPQTEIGSRAESVGIKENENIALFFGGIKYYNNGLKASNNEIWRMNLTNFNYAPINLNTIIDATNLCGKIRKGDYHSGNLPGARDLFNFLKISDKEALLIGGSGYLDEIACSKNFISTLLSDWWKLNLETFKWKFEGGALHEGETSIIFGEKNVYNTDNTIGARYDATATKVNEEEVMLFGGCIAFGDPSLTAVNWVQYYNTSSNNWKFVAGDMSSPYVRGYERGYSESNMIGGRTNHFAIRFNSKEILIIGGEGFAQDQKFGFLNDFWLFNIETFLFKFIGKEITKRTYNKAIVGPGKYSDQTTMAGVSRFVAHYLPKDNSLFVCTGNTNYDQLYVDDCWKTFYGQICDQKQDNDPSVCSAKGLCSNRNFCDCKVGHGGKYCEKIGICHCVLANTTTVCSGNGVCLYSSYCVCKDGFYGGNCQVKECSNSIECILIITVVSFVVVVLFVCSILFLLIAFLIFFLKVKKESHYNEEMPDISNANERNPLLPPKKGEKKESIKGLDFS